MSVHFAVFGVFLFESECITTWIGVVGEWGSVRIDIDFGDKSQELSVLSFFVSVNSCIWVNFEVCLGSMYSLSFSHFHKIHTLLLLSSSFYFFHPLLSSSNFHSQANSNFTFKFDTQIWRWEQIHSNLKLQENKLPTIPHIDSMIFILSCFEIMHAWFYHPTTIPVMYCQWITRMAKFASNSFILFIFYFIFYFSFLFHFFQFFFISFSFLLFAKLFKYVRMDVTLLDLLRGMKDGSFK